MKYKVIVRDYNAAYDIPSDKYLIALNKYYVSPIVELDMESDWEQALTDFDNEYQKYYPDFLYHNLELIPIIQNQ